MQTSGMKTRVWPLGRLNSLRTRMTHIQCCWWMGEQWCHTALAAWLSSHDVARPSVKAKKAAGEPAQVLKKYSTKEESQGQEVYSWRWHGECESVAVVRDSESGLKAMGLALRPMSKNKTLFEVSGQRSPGSRSCSWSLHCKACAIATGCNSESHSCMESRGEGRHTCSAAGSKLWYPLQEQNAISSAYVRCRLRGRL
jgi:hypothetical protein